MDHGIVLADFDNTRSFNFIMIRKFVPVNKNVTDFCCVLEFMDITGSCTVFGHLVGPFIFISSKTKRLQIIIDWKINCFHLKRQQSLSKLRS